MNKLLCVSISAETLRSQTPLPQSDKLNSVDHRFAMTQNHDLLKLFYVNINRAV